MFCNESNNTIAPLFSTTQQRNHKLRNTFKWTELTVDRIEREGKHIHLNFQIYSVGITSTTDIRKKGGTCTRSFSTQHCERVITKELRSHFILRLVRFLLVLSTSYSSYGSPFTCCSLLVAAQQCRVCYIATTMVAIVSTE